MNPYLEQFQTWLQEEDKADKTVATYIGVLTKFVTWYEQTEGKVFQPRDVTTIMIQDYRSFMMNTLEQKPATVNKALATIKTFFGWAVETGHTSADPSVKVRMKRIQKTAAPKWMTPQEENRLMFALDSEKNEFKSSRDHAIVYTMRYAGLRVEEVSDLKINHIDMRQGNVTVADGKGGKYRVLPMHNELKKALKKWLDFRHSSGKQTHKESDYLFVSERAGKLTTRGIEFMLDAYLERCGLLERSKDGVKLEGQHSCHSLRHTFCKRLVDAGVPLQEVRRLAGHDNVQTTLQYVEPSQHDLRKAIQMI